MHDKIQREDSIGIWIVTDTRTGPRPSTRVLHGSLGPADRHAPTARNPTRVSGTHHQPAIISSPRRPEKRSKRSPIQVAPSPTSSRPTGHGPERYGTAQDRVGPARPDPMHVWPSPHAPAARSLRHSRPRQGAQTRSSPQSSCPDHAMPHSRSAHSLSRPGSAQDRARPGQATISQGLKRGVSCPDHAMPHNPSAHSYVAPQHRLGHHVPCPPLLVDRELLRALCQWSKCKGCVSTVVCPALPGPLGPADRHAPTARNPSRVSGTHHQPAIRVSGLCPWSHMGVDLRVSGTHRVHCRLCGPCAGRAPPPPPAVRFTMNT
jgi:hypothetical protein